MPRRTSKFRPIHHQQLPLKPRYSAQRFQVLRSHRKNLRRGRLEATTGKEDVQDNLLARCTVFAFADTQISSRTQSTLLSIGLRLNINQPGPEALNQIISKRGHQPRSDPLDTNSSRAQQRCRLDSPTGPLHRCHWCHQYEDKSTTPNRKLVMAPSASLS